MSDAIIHALVRSRIAEISADVAACRAIPRRVEPGAENAHAPNERSRRGRTGSLTTHLALRDYLTAL